MNKKTRRIDRRVMCAFFFSFTFPSLIMSSDAVPEWIAIKRDEGIHEKKGSWISYSATNASVASTVLCYLATAHCEGSFLNKNTKRLSRYTPKQANNQYATCTKLYEILQEAQGMAHAT